MEIKASLKNLRMSPQKVRLVADLIRKKTVDQSLAQLKFANKRAALPILKLIQSAVANAKHNYDLADQTNLFVKEIKVGGGATLKRWAPKAHGRATPIRKRSCHIDLALGEINDSGTKVAKKREVEKPMKLEELAASAAKGKNKVKADKSAASKESKTSKEAEESHLDRPERAKTDSKSARGFAGKMFRRKAG